MKRSAISHYALAFGAIFGLDLVLMYYFSAWKTASPVYHMLYAGTTSWVVTRGIMRFHHKQDEREFRNLLQTAIVQLKQALEALPTDGRLNGWPVTFSDLATKRRFVAMITTETSSDHLQLISVDHIGDAVANVLPDEPMDTWHTISSRRIRLVFLSSFELTGRVAIRSWQGTSHPEDLENVTEETEVVFLPLSIPQPIAGAAAEQQEKEEDD